MAVSKKSIIDRAFRIANMTGTDAHQSPTIDNLVVFEDYFPIALRAAVKEGASNPQEIGDLKRTHTLAVVDGEVELPDTVLTECLDSASVTSDTDDNITWLSSFAPRYFDYVRPAWDQIAYFTVKDKTFLFREPGGSAGEFDGTVLLNTVSLPVVPVVATDEIVMGGATAERTIKILAIMVRNA